MGKTNAKGRSTHEPFIRLHRGVTGSAAWQSLSCEARALLIAIWERHNGSNNGRIGFGHRDARDSLHIGSRKVAEAFRALQETGFLVARTKSSFNWKSASGAGRTTEWEITTEDCDGFLAKRLYRDWKKQNTAPKAGTNGARGSDRLPGQESRNEGSGSQGGHRYADISQKVAPAMGAHLFCQDGGRERRARKLA